MKRLVLIFLTGMTAFAVMAGGYKGTPYKGEPHKVPGIIEAEDFDNGGEGISWHDLNPGRQNGGGQIYRDTDVDIEDDGGTVYIGNAPGGEWTKYTIDVAKDGLYSIATYCVSGDGRGYFHFELDDKGLTRSIEAPDGNWNDLSQVVVAENVPLTKGKHVLKWYSYGSTNVDKFDIRYIGKKQKASMAKEGRLNYPQSKKMGNPLFVEFDSPMFGTEAIGPLYTADPSAHVWNVNGKDVLYVYASHDMEPHAGCDRMDRYHVFSTEDMKTWTDHGEILNADDVRKQAGWGSDGFMWAPDCAYNPADSTYYYYFPHPENTENWNSTWRIGVAASKYPDRDFKVIGWIEGMPPYIDPCVFVDDDGQPYIYNGGSAKCFGGKLCKDDWTKLDGEMKPMVGLGDFHEATWVHKRNGKYYLSHSDNNNHREGNHMKYAVSDSPLGPWKDMGIYMYPTGFETNHGSIVEYKGKWYAFYHTANYSGRGALRSVCFDELEYNPDGSIKVVQNFGHPFKNKTVHISDATVKIEAEDYNDGGYHYAWFKKPSSKNIGNDKKYRKSDVAMSISKEGNNRYVSDLKKGEWVRYTIEVNKGGEFLISFVARSIKNKGNSKLHISSNGHNISGELTISGNDWQTIDVPSAKLPAGTQYLEFRIDAGDIDFDNFSITKL